MERGLAMLCRARRGEEQGLAEQGRGRRKRNCRNGTQEQNAEAHGATATQRTKPLRFFLFPVEAFKRSCLRLPLPLPSRQLRRVRPAKAQRFGASPSSMASKRQDATRRFPCPCPAVRPECPRTHRNAVPKACPLCPRNALRRQRRALSGHFLGPYGGAPLPSGAEPPAERSRPNFQNGMSMRGYLEMRQGRVKTSIGRHPSGRGNATAPALGWPKQHSRRRGSLRRFGTQDAADAGRRCRKERPEAGGRAGPFPHPVGGAWPFPADGGQPFPQEGKGGRPWASTI